jgi:tetratricopeptide (TPR) repeat protein
MLSGAMAWKRGACALAVIGLLISLSSCATYTASMRRVDQALAAQNPAAALKALAPMEGGRDQSLYLLNKAMILRMQGDYAASTDAFERAKHLMTYLEATSVSENAAALSLSENLRSFEGELYERLLLHVYLGLNYLQMDDVDSARVEVKQIDDLLKRLYPGTDAAPNGGDTFARYFSGMVYEDAGDWSDAMIGYRKAYQAYRAEGVADSNIPPDLQISLCRFADYLGLDQERDDYKKRFGIDSWPSVQPGGNDPDGQLVFVLSNGLAPRKVAATAVVQDPVSGHFFSISLPRLERRRPDVSNAMIEIADKTAVTRPVESIDYDATRALSVELPRLTAYELSRNVVRQAAANQADKNQPGMGALLSIIGTVVDQADTRIWNTLPDDIQLARLRLPPGTYDLKVSLRGRGDNLVQSRTFEDVVIKPGRMTFTAWHAVNY